MRGQDKQRLINSFTKAFGETINSYEFLFGHVMFVVVLVKTSI
jgi:hypothetical protein